MSREKGRFVFFPAGCLFVLCLALVLLAGPARPASAAVYVVDTTVDNGDLTGCDEATANDCSLRGAVWKANNNPGADTITLPSGRYYLTLDGIDEDFSAMGDLDVREDLTINGAGRSDTTIRLAEWTVSTDRLFDVHSCTLKITDVTLMNGGNSIGAVDGGGLRVSNGALEMTRSRVSYCLGVVGGGIYLHGNAEARLTDSDISQNSGGTGAGIATATDATGSLSLTGCTIAWNLQVGSGGVGGGGIYFSGNQCTITNCTISGNSAGDHGGGLYRGKGTVKLSFVTITDNTCDPNGMDTGDGGGIYCGNDGAQNALQIQNCIIAGNTDLSDSTYNNTSESNGILDNRFGNIFSDDPRLGPLQDNGGFTPTHALLEDSPALNAAFGNTGADGNAVHTDQRGEPRPQGDDTDSGAYESSLNPSDSGGGCIFSTSD